MRTEATAEVEVGVDPATEFEIFTTELDLWWVRGPINHYDASRLAELRIEPGVGGRVLEVYDEASGDVAAREHVTVWEPGKRLALEGEDTGVEIDFEAVPAGTRVPGGGSGRQGRRVDRNVTAHLHWVSGRAW